MTCWLCGFETAELVTNEKAPTCKNGPCQICIAVANVDEEINQAVATLRRLLAKRCDLRSEQNRVHGTLIHRLPAELKNRIFELLLPSRTEWGRIPQTERPAMTVMPSYLTSICRSWRDIAWSNPFLWSKMHIALGTQAAISDPSSRINFVHDWILRSRTLPLTFHISVLNRDKKGLEEELKGVTDAISECSNRWRSLSLDVPLELLKLLPAFHFHYPLLRKLRVNAGRLQDVDQAVPLLLNPTVCPERIEILGVPFQSLQFSWNHLSSAKVQGFDLEEITQLFQHASQMTYCHILSPRVAQSFSMPPIVHQRLKTLSLDDVYSYDVAFMLLGSLTLPCLQKFGTHEMFLLTSTYLPALVHRSSCPLASIIINTECTYMHETRVPDNLQPLPGVSDLVLESVCDHVVIQKILLEEYFPDLHHLTLRIQPFFYLWDMGVIPLLLDRNRPRPNAPNEGRLRRLLVVDEYRPRFDVMRNPLVTERLKALDVVLREDGFEF